MAEQSTRGRLCKRRESERYDLAPSNDDEFRSHHGRWAHSRTCSSSLRSRPRRSEAASSSSKAGRRPCHGWYLASRSYERGVERLGDGAAGGERVVALVEGDLLLCLLVRPHHSLQMQYLARCTVSMKRRSMQNLAKSRNGATLNLFKLDVARFFCPSDVQKLFRRPEAFLPCLPWRRCRCSALPSCMRPALAVDMPTCSLHVVHVHA